LETRSSDPTIADAANVSRASLYRLLAAEGGIRAVLLKRRLDEALRLMLADNKDERSLTDIARCCGLGGTSQLSRAFRARFGMPPRQYLALVRQQDLDWHEARLITDGFDRMPFYGGNRGWAPLRHMEPGMRQSRSSPVIRIKPSEIPNPTYS